MQGFDTVKVTVNDPKDIEKIIEQVKHFPDYEENVYNIYANDEVYKNTAISLENLDKLVIGLLLVIIIWSHQACPAHHNMPELKFRFR